MAALETSPRGPVVRPKSGTLDYPDNYIGQMKRARAGMRAQALTELDQHREWSQIGRYIEAIEGAWWDKKMPRHRSRFTDNHLSRARVETMAQYTDAKPAISVTAGAADFEAIAKGIHGVMQNQWLLHDFDLRLAECLDHGMLEMGFWKNTASRNRLNVIPCGMDTVLPIHCTNDIQKSTAVLYRTFKPLAYFNHFSRGKQVQASARTHQLGEDTYNHGMMMTEYTWSRLSPFFKRALRNRKPSQVQRGDDFFPVAELEEYWFNDYETNDSGKDVIVKNPELQMADHNYWYRVKPGERLWPRKRLVIWGGDTLIYDGPSPFWMDMYPFSMCVLNPIVWGPGGLSKYRDLYPLNKGINEVGAGVLDTIKKAINQTYVAKRGSIFDADWEKFFPDLPGQKIRVNPTGDPSRDIHALAPPQLPSYVLQFLQQYLMPSFDRHAGSLDVGSLSKKKQVPGGDTMEQIRDAQGGPVRLEGRYIEAFLRDSGVQHASHVLQYFDWKGRYAILGQDGVVSQDFEGDTTNMVPAGHAKESFWKQFQVIVAPGSIHGANRDREQTKAFGMYRAGALSLETFLTKAGVADPKAEMKRIKEEHDAGMGAQGGGGRTPRMSRGQRNGQMA